MQFLSRVPFARIMFHFMVGIGLGLSDFFKEVSNYTLIPGIASSCLLAMTLFGLKAMPQNRFANLLNGISFFLFICVTGIVLCDWHKEKKDRDHYSKLLTDNPACFAGYISKHSLGKERGGKAGVDLVGMNLGEKWVPVNGKTIVYFKTDENSDRLSTGEMVVFSGKMQGVKSPINPYEFDYRDYLERQNIYNTIFVKSSDWRIMRGSESHSLSYMAAGLREKLVGLYRESGLSDEAFALADALVLGYTGDIDKPLLNAYSHTGTLHVLSVSGLHVGIIYLLLGSLLKFMERNRVLKALQYLVILLSLWFFVLLSGFSAPAVRAALMFSLILSGKFFYQDIETANIVLFSAFVSLCINPFWLIDPGFQLSYLAVLAIIYLYPFFYSLLSFDNYVPDKIWALCSVSMAAQAVTLPLSLYYFHQFPLLFLFANLIIIPLSTLIMYGGILILVFYKVGFVVKIFVWLTDLITMYMNRAVRFFDQVPFCSIDSVHITMVQVLLLYLFLVLIGLCIEQRSYRLLRQSFMVIFFFIFISIFNIFKSNRENELVIFHARDSNTMVIYQNNRATIFSDHPSHPEPAKVLRENRIMRDCVAEQVVDLGTCALVVVGTKKVLFLNKSGLLNDQLRQALYVDHIWEPDKIGRYSEKRGAFVLSLP